METDEEKLESLLRYIEATGQIRYIPTALKWIFILRWRKFWKKPDDMAGEE